MSAQRHYPSLPALRHTADAVSKALYFLSRLGVQVKTIGLEGESPAIETYFCPGNQRLRSEVVGQGGNPYPYVLKQSLVHGCRVIWREAVRL